MRITSQQTDAPVLQELGSRLRRTRLERNLSQSQLADQAGVGRATVQRIEDGESASLTNLIRILRSLELLEGLNQLLPEPTPSPIDQLKRQGRQRQRAGSPRTPGQPQPEPRPWRWGDERSEHREEDA